LPNKTQLIWLFFRFSGRINRAAYLLAILFLIVVQAFLVYRLVLAEAGRHPDQLGLLLEATTQAGRFWAAVLWLSILVSVWAHLALSVKRLHDMGKPGILSVTLFIPVVSIIVFFIICVLPGNPGPNRYGQRANEPG